MFENILDYVHNGITLLFGVYISAAFLGIRMNRKNICILFGFSCSVGFLYIVSFALFGSLFTEQVYPMIVHLPLVIFLTVFYKYKWMLSSLSVLTAYLCCQISNWIGLFALTFTHLGFVYYLVRIAVTIVTFTILMSYITNAAAQLLQKPMKDILIFGLVPFVYYLFDYFAGVYTALLYSGKEVVVEFLGFILCIAYLLFLLLYFKQYEEKQEAQQRNRMMEMQYAQSKKEVDAMKRSEKAASILRHDMRHFLLNIASFIENGECDRAYAYITEIISTADKTATQRYCRNEIVNMILTSHEQEMRDRSIDFKYAIQIPDPLPISDVDLTSILSNALENAIHGASAAPHNNRSIHFDLHMSDTRLLLSIKNTYGEAPVFVNGIPQSKTPGHGFGTQSICHVVEKMCGNCQFSVKEDWFVVRVIL